MAQIRNQFLAVILGSSLAVMGGCASTPEEEKPMDEGPAEVEAAPATSASAAGSYTVVGGDNLWAISGKPRIYGNPYQWPLIYKANTDKIKDADLIYPGQVLAIDENPSSSDIDAAVRHAKTRGAWTVGAVEESDRAYLSRY